MPSRRRPQFTQESIDQQLQQIHLLDQASSSENLEQLGPIIKQIHANRQQEVYLRTLQALIESKDAEIESICGDNYQEFISSVSTLFSIKSYTTNLREKITTLDSNVSQVGKSLVEKKKALLQTKKTAANLDEAIDGLQACLRVLDVVNRVGEMVKEGKYWSALRSLEDIESMPPPSLLQTPLFQYLLSSLPSLRGQIKDAVTASVKQWLLDIRNVSAQIGQRALEAMEMRTRRWRSRRDKDPMLKSSRVGSAVETITYEKTGYNVLDNDQLQVDFKPLYECIHIYSALDSVDEIRRSYQADRKAQSDLIIPEPLPLSSLPSITQEIVGYFIIETHVLNTTGSFRSEREVEDLWDALISRLSKAVEDILKTENDPNIYLQVKEALLGFVMTLESYSYSTTSIHSLILHLFEKYVNILEIKFGKRFENIIAQDDLQPMYAEKDSEKESVMDTVWLTREQRSQLQSSPAPLNLPWSQGYYLCCQDIRSFVQNFYQFIEGVSQHHRNIDDLLSKSLDTILITYISESLAKRAKSTANVPQIAQIITNLEHFEISCTELERSLTNIRSSQRGGTIRVKAAASFVVTRTKAIARVTEAMSSKLDEFFELSEYDWTPSTRKAAPSDYLDGLVTWLTSVVDSLTLKDTYKEEAYRGAVGYIASCFLDFLTGRDIPMMNENAIANLLLDIDFLDEELRRNGHSHGAAFTELRSMASVVMSDAVNAYLVQSIRQTSYPAVKPKRLAALLEKLARYGMECRDAPSRERGEKRRKEAEAVGRLFPGENR
ncbi:exocyst complex component sec15 subunit [Lentinus tigrinus ALCF2SS1-7]|uniref:Exocyst complex component SEC15 n=1 Tax=Lentinus tigrinus ALCF2SS1-6 TaxID=1328759 RepID=A0A5C2SM39_9APHY|nr:exocyst complex component sec15 subunit [Lentinus tigrinus ALCF2SS1-6]RPD76553.1 exocyst complex component sec15 subunit [Lentinus tigrinus ALCF2SS1-7]